MLKRNLKRMKRLFSKKRVDKDHADCYNTCMNKGVLLEGNPPKVRPFFIYF